MMITLWIVLAALGYLAVGATYTAIVSVVFEWEWDFDAPGIVLSGVVWPLALPGVLLWFGNIWLYVLIRRRLERWLEHKAVPKATAKYTR